MVSYSFAQVIHVHLVGASGMRVQDGRGRNGQVDVAVGIAGAGGRNKRLAHGVHATAAVELHAFGPRGTHGRRQRRLKGVGESSSK